MNLSKFAFVGILFANVSYAGSIVKCFDVNSPHDTNHLLHKIELSSVIGENGSETFFVTDDELGLHVSAYEPTLTVNYQDFISATGFVSSTPVSGQPVSVELTVYFQNGPVLGSLFPGKRYVRYYPDALSPEPVDLYCDLTAGFNE